MFEDMGYTPQKLLQAWTNTFAIYHQYFPNQCLSLSLFPGPEIPKSTCPALCSGLALTLKVVAIAKRYGALTTIQENGLCAGGREIDHMYNIVKAHCNDVDTGLQTAAPNMDDPLPVALAHGVAAHVRFLEVYETDAGVASILKTFETHLLPAPPPLPATKGCTPLSLSANPNLAEVTATTDLSLAGGQVINLFANGHLFQQCVSVTCGIATKLMIPTMWTADVGAPGTTPFSPEALVSARLQTNQSPIGKPIISKCPGGSCN